MGYHFLFYIQFNIVIFCEFTVSVDLIKKKHSCIDVQYTRIYQVKKKSLFSSSKTKKKINENRNKNLVNALSLSIHTHTHTHTHQ